MNKSTHGGPRAGAGRKKTNKERLRFWTYPQFKEPIEALIAKLEKQYETSKLKNNGNKKRLES